LRKVLFIPALFAALAACSAASARPALNGSWAGSYSLHGASSLAITVRGSSAEVALGVGHADVQRVKVRVAGASLSFAIPGRPSAVRFSGRLRGAFLTGRVRQGNVRGTFRLRRGGAPALFARGYFRVGGRTLAVVDDPYGPARLVDADTGEVHALYPRGGGFEIGGGFASRTPLVGIAQLGPAGGTIAGQRAIRIPVRQLEVRFRSGDATLAGTLTIPPGPGRHAAVAFVHGSGPTTRAYLPDLDTPFVRNGVAVLAYDKRGIGQSSGTYPGESPSAATIATLARDAEAAARFLASQPELDPARVGLAGHSQAGWIMPLAANEEPAVHGLVVFSGPAVTADENDRYQNLTGEGVTPQPMSDAEIDAAVLRAGPGGVDPIPWIRRLTIPAIWLYGARDETIPSRLSAQRLGPIVRESGGRLSIETFPDANHALVNTKTGLTSEMLESDRFAPGLFARVAAWLRANGFAA